MTWLILAIISPLIFAIVNIIDDNLMNDVFDNAYLAVIVSGLFTAIPILALLFTPLSLPSTPIIVAGLTSGFIMTCSWYFYFDALRSTSPSIVITVYNLQAAFTAILAYLLLNEILYFSQYLGFFIIFLASLGITAIDIKKLKFSKILFTVGFGSILLAGSNILSDYIFSKVEFLSAWFLILLGNFIAALAFIVFSPKGRQFFKKWKNLKHKFHFFLIVELLSISAFLFYDLALSKGPASLVSVLSGLQPAFILIISILFYPLAPKVFREVSRGNLAQKSIFIFLMLFGLYLVS